MVDTMNNRFGVHARPDGSVVVMGLTAGRALSKADVLELVGRLVIANDEITPYELDESLAGFSKAIAGQGARPPASADFSPTQPAAENPYARFARASQPPGPAPAAPATAPGPLRRPVGPESMRITSLRIFSESASKSSRIRAATPSFSRTSPSRMCSVPM